MGAAWERRLPDIGSGHNPEMNYFSKNLKYLRQRAKLSEGDLAKRVHIGQTTINRMVTTQDYDPKWSSVVKIAQEFRVDYFDLMLTDLSNSEAEASGGKRDVVRIDILDGFKPPRDGLLDAVSPFEDSFEVRREWFDRHVGLDREHVRFITVLNDQVRDEFRMGSLVLIDTRVNDVPKMGPGFYAFRLGDEVDFLYGTRLGDDSYEFKGTVKHSTRILVEGAEELRSLHILGRAFFKMSIERDV